jgi:hypothetical protein
MATYNPFLPPITLLGTTDSTATGLIKYGVSDSTGLGPNGEDQYIQYTVSITISGEQLIGDSSIRESRGIGVGGKYNGLDVKIGDYIAAIDGTHIYKIVDISSKSSLALTITYEDTNMSIARMKSNRNNTLPGSKAILIFRLGDDGDPKLHIDELSSFTTTYALPAIKTYFDSFKKRQTFTFSPVTTGSLEIGDLVSVTGSGNGYELITASLDDTIVGTVTNIYGGNQVSVTPFNNIITDYPKAEKLIGGEVGSTWYNSGSGEITITSGGSAKYLQLTNAIPCNVTGSDANPTFDETSNNLIINNVEVIAQSGGGSTLSIEQITSSINSNLSSTYVTSSIDERGGLATTATLGSAGSGGSAGTLAYSGTSPDLFIPLEAVGTGTGNYPSAPGKFAVTGSGYSFEVHPTTADIVVSGFGAASAAQIVQDFNSAATSAGASISAVETNSTTITITDTSGNSFEINNISNDSFGAPTVGASSGTGLPTGVFSAPAIEKYLVLERNDGGDILIQGSWPNTADGAGIYSVAGTRPYLLQIEATGGGADSDWYEGGSFISASTEVRITGSTNILGDLTVKGTGSFDVLHTTYETSSIIYSSGSTKFGDTLDDTHQFTGSVSITGSLSLDGIQEQASETTTLVIDSNGVVGYRDNAASSGTSGTSGVDGTHGTSGTSGIDGTHGTSGTSGADGTHGTSGTSGENGTSGTSGENGTSGTSGENGTSGTSGENGTSGTSGENGTSGTSGENGTSGTSGENGTSGTSGVDGTHGTSGSSGINGENGTHGTSGTSGINGENGTHGTSGTSGINGENGTHGTSGTSGINGENGTHGTSGSSGTSGEQGTHGTSGTSGTSGLLDLSGSLENGLITYDGDGSGTVESNASFNNNTLTITGSLIVTDTASIGYLETIYESSSIIYSSGSTKFGDTLDDTHQFTGSLTVTGSLGVLDLQEMPTETTTVVVNSDGTFGYRENAASSGTSGTSGVDGSSGSSGTSGTSGTSGVDGSSGSSGTSGVDGSSGSSGTSGVDGSSGSSGTSGVDGSSGSSGTSGVDGSSGSSGTSGVDGSSGTSGIDGTSGTSGIDGSSGTSGIDGTSGTTGTSGTSGNQGSSGSSGTSGINGENGTHGTSGTSGNQGSSGTSGTAGTSGTSGIDGTSGTTGTSGTSGNQGSSGSSGTSGEKGENGTHGTSGTNGADGTHGTSGTAGTSGESLGGGYVHTQSSAATTWEVTHSLNTRPLNVDLYDSNYNLVITEFVSFPTANTAEITFSGNTAGYAIFSSISASYTQSNSNDTLQDVTTRGNTTSNPIIINSDLTVSGTGSFGTIHSIYETSSIIYSSGSTKFGDTLDDTHQFTGSVEITGSLDVNGNIVVDGNISSTVFQNSYGSDSAAQAAGVPLYGLYRNGSIIVVRLT